MTDQTESGLHEFQEEIQSLADELSAAFEAEETRFYYNDESESLYIEISGLDKLNETEIERIAEPILNDTDLDLEEIILLPLQSQS